MICYSGTVQNVLMEAGQLVLNTLCKDTWRAALGIRMKLVDFETLTLLNKSLFAASLLFNIFHSSETV